MNFFDFALIVRLKLAYALAYFPVVTLAGFLQAWFMNLLGDSKSKEDGFMSLNPATHFDSYGFFILMFPWQLFGVDINIGFGKAQNNDLDGVVVGNYGFFRKALIMFSSAISYLASTLFFLILTVLYVLFLMKSGTTYVEMMSGFGDSVMLVMRCITALSLELFFVFFIINLVDLILYKFDKNGTVKYNPFLRLLFILVLASLVLPLMKIFFVNLFGKLILKSM